MNVKELSTLLKKILITTVKDQDTKKFNDFVNALFEEFEDLLNIKQQFIKMKELLGPTLENHENENNEWRNKLKKILDYKDFEDE